MVFVLQRNCFPLAVRLRPGLSAAGAAVLVGFLLTATGCLSRRLARAEKALRKGDCALAARHFSRLSAEKNVAMRAFAQKAAAFCSNDQRQKSLPAAVFFYEESLSLLKGPAARKMKKALAGLLFHKLKNYERALKYYIELKNQAAGKEAASAERRRESFDLGYQISDGFRRLNKPRQALQEINQVLKRPSALDSRRREKAAVLKAGLLLTLRDYEKAIPFFREQIKNFPESADFFRRYLALVLEHQSRLASAARELEKISSGDPFLEKKIKDLTDRLNNRPGVSL